MTGLRERMEEESGRKTLMDLGLRLESGEPGAEFLPDPFAVVAALALAGLDPEGPPLVRASPRRPKLKAWASEPAIARLFPKSPRTARLALSAGLLQILDFWDESHQAAQEADDLGERPHSAFWHAIAHRREPDPGNASYWFRRVGRHPAFEPLAEAVRARADPGLVARLLRDGAWDPTAFLDLCRDEPRGSGPARRVQAIEMALLLDATAAELSEG